MSVGLPRLFHCRCAPIGWYRIHLHGLITMVDSTPYFFGTISSWFHARLLCVGKARFPSFRVNGITLWTCQTNRSEINLRVWQYLQTTFWLSFVSAPFLYLPKIWSVSFSQYQSSRAVDEKARTSCLEDSSNLYTSELCVQYSGLTWRSGLGSLKCS